MRFNQALLSSEGQLNGLVDQTGRRSIHRRSSVRVLVPSLVVVVLHVSQTLKNGVDWRRNESEEETSAQYPLRGRKGKEAGLTDISVRQFENLDSLSWLRSDRVRRLRRRKDARLSGIASLGIVLVVVEVVSAQKEIKNERSGRVSPSSLPRRSSGDVLTTKHASTNDQLG